MKIRYDECQNMQIKKEIKEKRDVYDLMIIANTIGKKNVPFFILQSRNDLEVL